MAVVISRSNLSEEHIDAFVRDLTKASSDDSVIVSAYDVDRLTNSVLLPHNYGTIFAHKNKLPLVKSLINHVRCKLEFKGVLKDYQIETLKIVQGHLSQYFTTTVALHPGAGKTVIGSALSVTCGFRTIILLHRTVLIKQWIKTFVKFTNAKLCIVGDKVGPFTVKMLRRVTNEKGEVVLISEELTVYNYPESEADVIICMDQRVEKISTETRQTIGTLIIDEAHTFCTPTRIKFILKLTPKVIIALTATPDRQDKLDEVLYALVGKHRITKSFNLPFKVTVCHTKVVPVREYNYVNNKLKWHVFVQSLYGDPLRNKYIFHKIMTNQGRKILVLTSEIKHVDAIIAMVSPYRKCAKLAGSIKEYSNSPVLVGTVSKIGTGFDEENFCDDYDGDPLNLLIMCCSYRNRELINQNIGRIFRSERPHVIYLLDNDTLSKAHCAVFKGWAKDSGGIIEEVVLQPDLLEEQLKSLNTQNVVIINPDKVYV